MPRKYNFNYQDTSKTTNQKQTLSQYFFKQNCILCNKLSQHYFCKQCEKNPQYLILQLNNLLLKWSKKQNDLEMVKIKSNILNNYSNNNFIILTDMSIMLWKEL